MTDEYPAAAAESNVVTDGEDTETVISNKGIQLKENIFDIVF
jgi:hypothetical protein